MSASLDKANAPAAVSAIARHQGDAQLGGEKREHNQRERADAGQYKIHGGVLLVPAYTHTVRAATACNPMVEEYVGPSVPTKATRAFVAEGI